MAIAYTVEHHWAGRVDARTYRRADAAEYAFRRLVRNELVAGWAGLDTAWGWRLCDKANELAETVNRNLPDGIAFEVALPQERGGERALLRVTRS